MTSPIPSFPALTGASLLTSHSISEREVVAFRGSMKLTFSPSHVKRSMAGGTPMWSKHPNHATASSFLTPPSSCQETKYRTIPLDPPPSPLPQSKCASFPEKLWKQVMTGWSETPSAGIFIKHQCTIFPSHAPETSSSFQIFLSVQRELYTEVALC